MRTMNDSNSTRYGKRPGIGSPLFPSPRPSPSGRGRNTRRFPVKRELAIPRATPELPKTADRCSLSQGERVRVRGKGLTKDPAAPEAARGGIFAASGSVQSLLAIVCSVLSALSGAAAEPIWSIGKPDGVSVEFAPGARDHLTFAIGQSVVSRDFAGNQSGSAGWDGKIAEKPYTISFDLDAVPQGRYELVLDLIFSSGGPRQFKVRVNDKLGIFPLQPAPKHSSWGDQANEMLLSQQQLVVPIDGAWLKAKGNQIGLIPLGIGGLAYDAVTFRRASASGESPRIEPTIFFRKRGGKLVELCNVVAPFEERFDRGSATVRFGKQSFSKGFTNALYDFGLWVEPVEISVGTIGSAQSRSPGQRPPSADLMGRGQGEGPLAAVEVALDGRVSRAEDHVRPAKQWKVFVCPKVHNDVGYTDLQPHVNELDNRNSDQVLDILDKYPFYKFNFETAWLVDNFLDCRTGPSRKEFLTDLKRQRLAMNALYLNLMTGICSGEELYRAMYFTHRLHREQGGNFDFACITDAPSHSWFLPTLFHDVGIKGFSNGSNQTRAPILHYSDLNEDSPFWWEGMNGERIFMWYARSYVQLKRLVGPGWGGEVSSVEYLKSSVPQFLVRYLRDNYAPDAVMIYGAYVDNAAIPENGEAETIAAWNKEFEFPKLVVATDAEYFNYVEKHFANQLPVHRGDCGAYWEDGVGSTAKATTLNRQSQQILPAAETAAALASLFEPRNRFPARDFWNAWRNVMFYDEHTWGAHNSIAQPGRQFVERQWEVKESYATRANLDARTLLERANNRLAQEISVNGSSIIAFNWQNRARTAPLQVEIGSGEQLVDLADDRPVPMDVFFERDGWRKIRFVATNVPAMGYKAYGIRGLNAAAHEANEKISGGTIENSFYRLTLDPQTGAIRSLFDKTENRELADAAAPYRLNEYLYVSGGEGSLILNCNFGTAPANLQIVTPVAAEIIECVKTPLGQRLVVNTQCTNTPGLRSEYLLYDRIKRVDIVNTLEKVETRAKEAIYFAFPFAAEKPGLEYQIQNGWCRPNDDQMPGACREWFTPQNLVHVSDGAFSVAWSTPDAPLVTLTDINRGKWLSHLPIKNGHVYSYALNNYWFTNYRAQQGGTFVFRYSITSGRGLGREELARFDEDTRTPVIAYPHLSSFSAAIAQAGRPMPASGGSFLTLDAPGLQIVTLKEAEDGDGFILRLREIAGRAGEAELRFPVFQVREAFLCNGVEENKQKLVSAAHAASVPYKPNAFTTVRLKADRPAQKVAKN
jgi:alpha-mannosidase